MYRFLKDENGQGTLEYVLIISLVVITCVALIVVIRNYSTRVDFEEELNNLAA